MIIESTVHVHVTIKNMLDRVAALTGSSRTFLIILLMQRVMHLNSNMLKTFTRVKYQDRDVKENWHRLHIAFREYEYEYCQDMRKFFKMSVSYILAYAVRMYLDALLCELLDSDESTDNYYYRNYIIIKKTLKKAIYWQIYWGIPHAFPPLSLL